MHTALLLLGPEGTAGNLVEDQNGQGQSRQPLRVLPLLSGLDRLGHLLGDDLLDEVMRHLLHLLVHLFDVLLHFVDGPDDLILNLGEGVPVAAAGLDSALLRYFMSIVLRTLQQAYSLPLIRSLGALLSSKPCADALR